MERNALLPDKVQKRRVETQRAKAVQSFNVFYGKWAARQGSGCKVFFLIGVPIGFQYIFVGKCGFARCTGFKVQRILFAEQSPRGKDVVVAFYGSTIPLVLHITQFVVAALFAQRFVEQGRGSIARDKVLNFLFNALQFSAVVVGKQYALFLPEFGVVYFACYPCNTFALQHADVVLYLPHVRLLHCLRFFDFVDSACAGIVKIESDIVDFEFVPPPCVGGIGNCSANGNCIGGMLHSNAVGKEPEFAFAQEKVVYVSASHKCNEKLW